MLKIKKRLFIGIFSAVLFFTAGLSYGYVLKGHRILRLMLYKSGYCKNLKVLQTTSMYQGMFENSAAGFEESVIYQFPYRFRSDMKTDTGVRTYLLNSGRVSIFINGTEQPDAETEFDVYKDIILFRTTSSLLRALSRLGIDMSVSSYGFFLKEPVYIIGAEFLDNSQPQLWVHKDSFMPCRLITKTVDIHYLDWKSFGKIQAPTKILFYRNYKDENDKPLQKINVKDVFVDIHVPAELFNEDYYGQNEH